jgi:uncharacterized membrane-anchored protein YhcB (DUF1043 family)
MKKNNKINAILIILGAILLGLACSSANQQEEANKIIDAANKKLDEAKALYTKTDARNTDLFSAKVQTVGQLQAYKASKNGEAKSIADDFEKTGQMLKDVAKQYDDVSRMNVNDKYKEYAKLKSDEFYKRAEAVDVRKGNAQAFMEIDDYKTMVSKFDENNKKSDQLFKDADDIETKAKKIEDDNKDIFK